jgi:hypothetical protein
MDTRGTPSGILRDHLEDQLAYMLGLGRLRLSTASCRRSARFSSIRLWRVQKMRQKVPSHSRKSLNIVANFIPDSICDFLPMSLNSKADKIVTSHTFRAGYVGVSDWIE